MKRKHRDVAGSECVKKEEEAYDWKISDSSLSTQYDKSMNALPEDEVDACVKLDPDLEVPPRKKQRIIVEVHVPTWEEVRQRKLNKAALEKTLKIKKKKGAPDIVLNDAIRESRLALINNHVFEVKVPAAVKDQHVTREFMARTYGGSMQAKRPNIKRSKLLRHGYDNFAYIHCDYHPHAPGVPGHPGLFYGTKSGEDWEGEHRVFSKDPKKALWWYHGQYEVRTCLPLTREEWKSHSLEVRAHWATQIYKQKWGQYARSRIQARMELGRAATPEEAEIVRQSGRWDRVTALHVMEAYDRGDEVVGVWTMKCVGYDEVFQRELCEKFPRWVKPPPKPKTKGAKKSTRQRKAKRSPTAKQPKREETHDHSGSDFESEDEDLSEDDLVESEAFPLMRRGTRSRLVVF